MRIFNNANISEFFNDTESYPAYTEPTMEAVVEMGAKFTESVYKLNTSLYITDLLLEQKAVAGEDIRPLMEAAVIDFFTNMKRRFNAMKDKVKAFFNTIFNKIQVFASDGKKFMELYKDGILRAAKHPDVQWITYEEQSYMLTKDAGMTGYNTLLKDLHDAVNKIHQIPDNLIDGKSQEEFEDMFKDSTKLFLTDEEITNNEVYKKFVADLDSGEVSKSGVVETLNPQTLNTFVNYVNHYVTGGKDNMKRSMDECNNMATSIISKLQQIESKVKANSSDEVKLNFVSKACTEMSESLRDSQKLTSKIASMYTKSYKYSLKILRSFVSKNAAIIEKSNGTTVSQDANTPPSTGNDKADKVVAKAGKKAEKIKKGAVKKAEKAADKAKKASEKADKARKQVNTSGSAKANDNDKPWNTESASLLESILHKLQ